MRGRRLFVVQDMGVDFYASPPIHGVYGPSFAAIDFQRTGTAAIAPSTLGGGVSNAVESA
ncbi:hypothetical protein BJ322DRAFT_1206731, partial [Thelephora terrestris]